jgi:hypothetical protein
LKNYTVKKQRGSNVPNELEGKGNYNKAQYRPITFPQKTGNFFYNSISPSPTFCPKKNESCLLSRSGHSSLPGTMINGVHSCFSKISEQDDSFYRHFDAKNLFFYNSSMATGALRAVRREHAKDFCFGARSEKTVCSDTAVQSRTKSSQQCCKTTQTKKKKKKNEKKKNLFLSFTFLCRVAVPLSLPQQRSGPKNSPQIFPHQANRTSSATILHLQS